MAQRRPDRGHAGTWIQPIAELPTAALSQPRHILRIAEAVLADTDDSERRSYAGQARGIALREMGDVRAAIRQLKSALDDAAAVDAAREADVAATLAATLAVAGRSEEALTRLDSALGQVTGVAAARIRVRQGSLLGELGRFDEAAPALRAAARTLRRAGDATWEARAVLNLAMVCIEIGDTVRADAALVRAEELLADAEHTFEAATARQYRGLVAVLEGRTPDALAHYDIAQQRFAAAGTHPWELVEMRADALLSAGLVTDALASAQQAVALLRQPGASAGYRARALLHAGDAALAAGDADLALSFARAALRLFRQQGRDSRATLARVRIVRARYANGERSRRLLRDAGELATATGHRRTPETIAANLLAGEVALDVGDRALATRHLSRARRGRASRSDLEKVLGWRAAALQARAAGRRTAMLRACEEGLQVLEAYQLTLGALETRAAATTHGSPLATLAVEAAIESGDPVQMLRWVERWRSTTAVLPPVRLPDDGELAGELAQLRLLRHRLDEATRAAMPAGRLSAEVAALEAQLRARTHRASAASGTATSPRVDIDDVLESLGDTRFVMIFGAADVVHVLVAGSDGVRHCVAGSFDSATHAVEFSRFALRRMTHRTFAGRALANLPAQAQMLEQQLFGPAIGDLGDGPVVIVPPASLASTPWGLLPSLRERSVSVAPSAAAWSIARRHEPPPRERVALVAGPGLRQAEVEVEELARAYPGATVLRAGTATASTVLSALDGAALAHVAAHGTFRGDNPLFSALQLDDGPLTVYDLQRMQRAPHRLVLSCCDTGSATAAGADEMLGLASALVPMGTAGVLASSVPVSDEAAVPFAVLIHQQLRAGASTAEALCAARIAADGPAEFALAHSFVAFGAR